MRLSFKVSWLRCEYVGLAVFRVVDAFVLAAEVEAPVVLEVAGGDEGAELRTASASASPHLAPVVSILSFTMCLQASSMIPVAMGQPFFSAVA